MGFAPAWPFAYRPSVARQLLARAAAVRAGETRPFHFLRAGRRVEAFLLRWEGRLLAYENVCRHLPVRLDGGVGRFFAADGCHLVCQAHQATYDPGTGLCVRGPCEGLRLHALPLEEVAGEVWLTGVDEPVAPPPPRPRARAGAARIKPSARAPRGPKHP